MTANRKKNKLLILSFTLVLFLHIFSIIYVMFMLIIFFSQNNDLKKEFAYLESKSVKIDSLEMASEFSIRSIANVDNKKVYIYTQLQVDSIYDVWYNAKTNNAYLRINDENINQFYLRKKHKYLNQLVLPLISFLIITILNILNFYYVKPLLKKV